MNRKPGKLATLTIVTTLLLTSLATPATASTSQWQPRPPLRQARGGLSVTAVAGRILAIGGFKDDDLFKLVEARPNAGRGNWHNLTPMPTARGNHAAAELGGRVYVMGGYDYVGPLDLVEKFNPDSGRWTKSRPLPLPRAGAGAASLGGLLYVAGGDMSLPGAASNITRSMIVYSPHRDTWKSVAPMPTVRHRLKLVASGRYLYAVGGQAPDGPSLTTVERYDPKSDSWRTLSPMRESRALSCVVETMVGRQRVLVAVAGVQIPPQNGRRTTEVYDIKADRWTLLDARLTIQRGSNDCATESDGTVLTIGGVSAKDGKPVYLSDVEALTIRPRDLSSR